MRRHLVTAVLALVVGATSTEAQLGTAGAGFGAECANLSSGAREFCGRVAEGIQVVQPRVGIALSGGNPVPGTASTMGMRLGAMPRISLALRATAARVQTGGIERTADDDQMTFAVPSINVDASVGLFSGLTLAPTIGGFGALDLLGSLGILPLPDGEGFSGSPSSWAAGARVGILRESFTAPGVSVSGMYRRLGDVEYGDPELQERDAYFLMDDLSGWTLRGAVSKRLLGLGLTAGAGYDRYSSGVRLVVRDAPFELATDNLETGRTTFFGNASLTMLILHLVGEVGWQSGGDPDGSADIPTEQLDKSALYGSIALRLTL
ncbi:MAG TPA: hypothetical protein VK939_00855 [Longimicrobiales bacterium]|nr:hypothetical protein [Longimicrobiales bacterium]